MGRMTERPRWTVAQAARECGVSPDTIRRRLKADAFPNADRSGKQGAWRIPVEDLIAAGLTPGKPSAPAQAVPAQSPTQRIGTAHRHEDSAHRQDAYADSSSLVKELEELRTALGKKDMQIDSAHTRIADLQANVEDLRTSLRMLEPPKPEPPNDPRPVEGETGPAGSPVATDPQPGFFRRLFARR